MPEFLKFIVIWAAFMLALGVITVLVPKIAAKIDKSREKYKDKKTENVYSLGQTSFMEPAEGQDKTFENKDIASQQRTE